jgi:hypothetical protein
MDPPAPCRHPVEVSMPFCPLVWHPTVRHCRSSHKAHGKTLVLLKGVASARIQIHLSTWVPHKQTNIVDSYLSGACF